MNIEKLEDFITQMPKELDSIIKQARYLYLELGKRSFYDRKIEYMMFGDEDQYAIYSSKEYATPNIIVCTTLTKQYQRLLNSLDINTKIIKDDFKHSHLEFKDENGIIHNADLTNDLKNIQFNCRTSYFATNSINQDTLRKIDMELGYITPNRGYSNDYWHILREKIDGNKMSNRKNLELILQSMKEFGDLSKLGESELFSMYEKFIKYCTDDKYKISFSSTKLSGKPEDFYVKLYDENQIVTYKLDRETLQFSLDTEQEKEEEKERS